MEEMIMWWRWWWLVRDLVMQMCGKWLVRDF
jgi:hypothetical protein